MSSTQIPALLAAGDQFAEALDHNDFETAAMMLEEDCHYEIGDSPMVGRAQIIDSYRRNAMWAAENLDHIEYESTVQALPNSGICITFVDHIAHRGLQHTYKCQQILRFSNDGLITSIRHVEIEAERKALRRFMERCGIHRD